MDWLILQAIYGATSALSFNSVISYLSGGTKPCYTMSNGAIYLSIDRLITKGLVKQELNSRGWKIWTITPAGLRAVAVINKKALEVIKGWQEQGK